MADHRARKCGQSFRGDFDWAGSEKLVVWLHSANVQLSTLNVQRPMLTLITELFQTNGGDGVHDALAYARVKFPPLIFEIVLRKMNRIANDDGDAWAESNLAVDRPGVERAEDSHWHNRGARFGDDKAEPG